MSIATDNQNLPVCYLNPGIFLHETSSWNISKSEIQFLSLHSLLRSHNYTFQAPCCANHFGDMIHCADILVVFSQEAMTFLDGEIMFSIMSSVFILDTGADLGRTEFSGLPLLFQLQPNSICSTNAFSSVSVSLSTFSTLLTPGDSEMPTTLLSPQFPLLLLPKLDSGSHSPKWGCHPYPVSISLKERSSWSGHSWSIVLCAEFGCLREGSPRVCDRWDHCMKLCDLSIIILKDT